MQNLPYLFGAYAIVWLVLFGYLFVVAAQVRTVRRDLELLKEQIGVTPPATIDAAGAHPPRSEGA